MGKQRGQLKTVLLVLVAVLYPFHWHAPIGSNKVNLSMGDPVVAVTLGLLLLGILNVTEYHQIILGAIALIAFGAIGILIKSATSPAYYSPVDGVFELVKLAASILWMVAIYLLVVNDSSQKIWIFTVVTAIVAGAFSGWVFLSDILFGVRRPSGPFENPNLFADYLLLSIFLSLTYLYRHVKSHRQSRRRIGLVGLSLCASFLGILSTASRSAFGALIVGLVVCLDWKAIVSRFRRNIRVAIGSTTATLGGLVLLLSSNVYLFHRFARLLNGEKTGNRLEVWSRSVQGVIEYPLTGIGLGQHAHYIDTSGVPATPHNTIVLMAAETGLIGLAIWLVLSIGLVREGFRLRFSRQKPAMRLFIGFFVATFANGMFHDIINFRSFWIAAGLLTAAVVDEFRDW